MRRPKRPARGRVQVADDRRIRQLMAVARWLVTVGICAVWGATCWSLDRAAQVGHLLFGVAVASQLVPGAVAKLAGLTLGIFLVLQAALSYWVSDDFKVHDSFRDWTIHVSGDGMRGVSGAQRFVTDAHGFRNSGNVDYEKKRGFRIFAIGGSTTEEQFIDEQETWTYLLSRKLSEKWGVPVEMINTGISGVRARHHLATLKRILSLQPDLVIFMIGVNDWNTLLAEPSQPRDAEENPSVERTLFRHTLLGRLLRDRGLLGGSLARPERGDAQTWYSDGSSYVKQWGSLNRADKRVFKPDRVPRSYEQWVQRIAATCAAAEVRCAFITQPSAYQPGVSEELKGRLWMTPPFRSFTFDFDSLVHVARLFNQWLFDLASRQGHLSCDLAGAIAPTLDNFFDDVHFTESGDRNVAQILSDCIGVKIRPGKRE